MGPGLMMAFALGFFVLVSSYHVAAQGCYDIDPSACVLMSQQRPDLCMDPVLSKTACPKFCNRCPIVCYQCNATVQDYHLCTKTVSCPQGHRCMRKELKSAVDGHHEYEMTCASVQECDDPWNSVSMFGKRHIASRDLSVTCCADNLCNYPEQTTLPPPTTTSTTTTSSTTPPSTTTTASTSRPTHGCAIDLVFVVDESNSLKHHGHSIKSFLQDVVSRLPVSDSEVHVGLGLFNVNSRPIFDLNKYHSKSDVLHALSTVSLQGGTGRVYAGLNYVRNHALTPAGGDRPAAPNVVVLITDDETHYSGLLSTLEHEVQSMATVISLEIGHVDVTHLASDTHHQFQLRSTSDLSHVDGHVSSLIC